MDGGYHAITIKDPVCGYDHTSAGLLRQLQHENSKSEAERSAFYQSEPAI